MSANLIDAAIVARERHMPPANMYFLSSMMQFITNEKKVQEQELLRHLVILVFILFSLNFCELRLVQIGRLPN